MIIKAIVSLYHALFLLYERFIMPFVSDADYGSVGYFVKRHPYTKRYNFANWGSRKWEYVYIEKELQNIGIRDKTVVDIGIGRPEDSNFYTFYVNSGCHLIGYDPDDRLEKITRLSSRCKIIRGSAEKMDIPSKSVDVVVCVSSFEHFPYGIFMKTIKDIHRILKLGGHFIVTLDMTHDKTRSARWAILEKTINGLSAAENDLRLKTKDRQVTLEFFLKLLSPYFSHTDKQIKNKTLPITDYVYSPEWNSYVGYLHVHKK